MPMFDEMEGEFALGVLRGIRLFVCGSEGVHTQGVARAHARPSSLLF